MVSTCASTTKHNCFPYETASFLVFLYHLQWLTPASSKDLEPIVYIIPEPLDLLHLCRSVLGETLNYLLPLFLPCCPASVDANHLLWSNPSHLFPLFCHVAMLLSL
ncbi:hypothetical protein DSO57_1015815 [Entomophthora muscae]|uniref:Uncharacterized protein n=1 Tax=Entomophthora muscae TaxID=34485 RepID=A0ACC2SU62_9FUNG|nr:hypothetical protein DSO57_1015815 [Entomophthora muscae]